MVLGFFSSLQLQDGQQRIWPFLLYGFPFWREFVRDLDVDLGVKDLDAEYLLVAISFFYATSQISLLK